MSGATDAFALGRSDLNGFLFADIGMERSGMPLSVISALARLDFDPWQEAGRLARLPRTTAADGLARLIAGLPASLWPMPDAKQIAARLVALLPERNDSPAVVVMQVRLNWLWLVGLAIALALIAASAASLAPPGHAGPPASTDVQANTTARSAQPPTRD